MAEQKIEFRKVRDFGEVINDTFVFLRQNLKPLLVSLFAISGIFMLGQAVISGLYQAHALAKIQQFTGATQQTDPFSRLSTIYGSVFTGEYFLMIILALLSFVSVKVVMVAYIKYYIENDGRPPRIDEIWSIFKKYFIKAIIYNIPAYCIVFIGLVLCLLPGIYFWVVLVPFNMILIIEDRDFSGCFSRCFEIIKENFWSSFGVYVITVIIYVMCTWVIAYAVKMLFFFTSNLSLSDYSEVINIMKSFLGIFSYSFSIIYLIAVALQYFSLAEQKDGTGILNRIDNIGSGNNNFDHVDEQY